MEKQLKDYLHLYIGCQIRVQGIDKNYRLQGYMRSAYKDSVILEYWNCGSDDDGYWSRDNGFHLDDIVIKPILRPLTDMTEEELKTVLNHLEASTTKDLIRKECHDGIGLNERSWIRWYYLYKDGYEDEKEKIVANLSNDENGLSVKQGNSYYRCYLKTIPFLLSKHFDIFNLIEAGLAIDATTLNLAPTIEIN